ncbi:cystatin-A [Sarcophilus harrisii]|uniref:Cystatin A n=1 Tax=Sarcophilus harrisii TaxID=9305 RepID=G3WKG0_SARHA|nr:cystatin-A [Sarcophilus harrisii]
MTSKMMTGGLSEAKSATPEIQELVDEIKPTFEGKNNKKYEEFKAVSYKSQVVAGVMYYVKVCLGNDEYAHLKIYRPLPHTEKPIELVDFQMGKTEDDEVTYF